VEIKVRLKQTTRYHTKYLRAPKRKQTASQLNLPHGTKKKE